MRDKVFIIIGILSLIVLGLELIGTIPENYGWIGYLGMMMFFLMQLIPQIQKTNEKSNNPLIYII